MERFCETSRSAEMYEEHFNLHRIINEVLIESNDLEFQVLDRSDTFQILIRETKVGERDTYGQLPAVIKKEIDVNMKNKKWKGFTLVYPDLEELAKSFSDQLGVISHDQVDGASISNRNNRRLGRKGMQIFETIDILLNLEDESIDRSLLSNKIVSKLSVSSEVIQSCFELYPWNNLLHDRIVSIFSKIFRRKNSMLLSQVSRVLPSLVDRV